MNRHVLKDKPSESRVLVVDDDEKSRRLMRDLLAVHGYQLSEAVDGEDALRQVEAEPPDVILMDIMMPKMDGIAVCRKLQADERTAPIPVLLVTALHDRADRLRGVASGATDFITKPIDTAEVLLRVRNVLRMKHLYDQRNDLLRLRENLSDMIVHDLRNPLLSISLCAQRIGAQEAPPPVTHLAHAILDQVQLLDRFIADLLTVSKMEQGHLSLQHTRIDVVELVRATLLNHQMLADSKTIRLEVVAPDNGCLAEVDENLLARLLDNLIINAIKFAPRDTPVTLRIRRPDEGRSMFRIHVEDEGPGIPLGYRESIFDKFEIIRMKDPAIPQTGLGLALCRMVAEAHGGRVYVESRDPKGSIFTVELPCTTGLCIQQAK